MWRLPTIFDRDLYNKYFLNYCFSNYTLLNIREFSKSRAMRAIRPRGVYESMCSRANVPKACQLLIFTYQVLPCQRANKRTNVPTCQQESQFCNYAWLKECQFFNYFSKENVFQLLSFSNMLNIFKFQEYLSNFRKFILENKEFKFWHLQNLVNEMQN